MKRFILLLFALHVLSYGSAQNKNTVFYDTAGQITTYIDHWAQVFTGSYKSEYDKKNNKRLLHRTTDEEFQTELRKTEKRIKTTEKLGSGFPDFDVTDIQGNRYTKTALIGKVVVINFWFIGCGPCEVESLSLNNLQKRYKDNDNVVFLSFARNNKEDIEVFLKDHPVLYNVIPTEMDYIKDNFGINAYPVNLILDKRGKYFYNSSASGIGIAQILQEQIQKSLNQ